uniref:Uncharacterized protein n=1 Tax=Anguilla anguilla TaxID=7936 RepID=A0A0E9TCN1_ANGAN
MLYCFFCFFSLVETHYESVFVL